ncbi:Early meiotic induction protein 1, partial [Massospora cicadina]
MSNYNQTGSFTGEPSISEHNDYAELRDEEITSPYTVIRGFDELMSCFSLGAQMVHYYRYGKRRDCDLQWEKFKFCMSLSTYRAEEKKRRIIEFEKKLESRRQGQ